MTIIHIIHRSQLKNNKLHQTLPQGQKTHLWRTLFVETYLMLTHLRNTPYTEMSYPEQHILESNPERLAYQLKNLHRTFSLKGIRRHPDITVLAPPSAVQHFLNRQSMLQEVPELEL